jgi:hypothetical protein
MRILILNLLVFIISSCSTRKREVLSYAQRFESNKTIFAEQFIEFSESNNEIESINIYENKRIEIYLFPDTRVAMNSKYSFIEFKDMETLRNDSMLIRLSPKLLTVTQSMIDLEIDQFSGRNGKVFMKFKGMWNEALVNTPYIWSEGLRTEQEMIELFNDLKSNYWIYKIDSTWMIISNP